MKRRFGAMAFSEDISSPESEENGEVLSLDSLREAFAALESESEPTSDVFPAETEEEEAEDDSDELADDENEFDLVGPTAVLDEGDSIELSPKTIVEAMLFVGNRENRPLAPAQAVEKMRNVTVEDVERAVVQLNDEYRSYGNPYTIIQEENGYRMLLRTEFEPILEKFYGKIREARLSQQAVDTLAVVAYRQPMTADQVQKLRRQPSGALLNQLVRRGLLEIRREVMDGKKVVLYETTERFLELFNLETIDDLPMYEDIDFR